LAKPAQSVTSVDVSPDEDRKGRILRYSIAMTIRFVCVILAVVVHGWLMWVCFAGAILLPYFAVVIANAQGSGSKTKPSANAVLAKPLTIDASAFVAASRDSEPNRE
jgi:hypothetical protein